MPSYHPSDTVQTMKGNASDNFALRYNHFLRIERDGMRYKVNFQSSAQSLSEPSKALVKCLRERQTQQLQQLSIQGVEMCCIDATVDWRLIVGLGSDHVQETNMTLHHIYGIPYIPGSAVKGILRHWRLQEEFDHDESRALKDERFIAIFGSQEKRGKVQFLDAYPEQVNLATDIMNPHFPDYYGGKAPPTDYQNPNPILFLTVEQTTFRFAFLANDSTLLAAIKTWFEEALQMKGIGAKTSVGYGYFRDFKDQTDAIMGNIQRQQQAEREAAERQQKAERLANLSPVEKLAEEINSLSDNPADDNRATRIYNEELSSLKGEEEQMLAQALKTYWQRIKSINKWSDSSRKQADKVQRIKSILGES